MYKHLFVPVDGSDLSHRAMDGSIELALQLGARITGFVVEPNLPLSTNAPRGDEFIHRIKEHEAKNEAHAAALLGQFETRAKAKGVQFTAHHVTSYSVDQTLPIRLIAKPGRCPTTIVKLSPRTALCATFAGKPVMPHPLGNRKYPKFCGIGNQPDRQGSNLSGRQEPVMDER